MTMRIALLGGGGHAAVIIEAMRAAGLAPAFIVDRNKAMWGRSVLEVPVIGDDDHLAGSGATHFIVSLGAVGPGRDRQTLFELGIAAGLKPLAIIHPTAIVSPSAMIGAGSAVLAGAVLCARATVGRNVIVNTRAVVEHDCTVGDHVHIATGACLSGQVQVSEAAFIGAGAAVRQNVVIGAHACIGLGSAVVRDVAAGSLVVGVPAEVKRMSV